MSEAKPQPQSFDLSNLWADDLVLTKYPDALSTDELRMLQSVENALRNAQCQQVEHAQVVDE